MPICPHCQAEISEEFGLVDCHQCGTAVLVNIDGSVSGVDIGGEEGGSEGYEDSESPDVSEISLSSEDLEVSEGPMVSDFTENSEVSEMSTGLETPDFSEQGFDSTGNELSSELNLVTDEEENGVFVEEPFTSVQELSLDQADQGIPKEHVMFESGLREEKETSSDMSDVVAFGNSELSQGREGNLRYNIIISGIDTAELREALKESMTDRKFMWDAEALLKEVEGGELIIKDLPAVKSFILIDRIKGLPIKIRWEQYVLQSI